MAISVLHSADESTIGAQDATKQAYEFTVSVTSGDRIALGVVALATDDADEVTFSVDTGSGFSTIEARTLNKDNLANLSSSYFEDGVIWAATTSGSVTFKLEVTSGTMELKGAICREPDSASGIVEDQGTATHCHPVAAVYSGNTYQVHFEIYTGDLHLSKDGVAQGKVHDAIASDYNEHYHNGGAVVPLSSGILVIHVGHNQSHLGLKYLPNGNIGSASPHRSLGSGSYTYAIGKALSNDNVLILTRDNNDLVLWTLTNATDLVTQAASGTEDVIAASNRNYPKYMEVSDDGGGNEAALIAWGVRSGSEWQGLSACIYGPDVGSVGEFYSLDGDDANTQGSRGTSGTPRFSSSQETTLTKDGNGILILDESPMDGTDNQRYAVEAAIGEVSTFPDGTDNGKGRLLSAFSEADNDSSTYEETSIRFVLQNEGARSLSPYDFLEPTPWLEDPNSYRVSGGMSQIDASTVALVITDRGTATYTNQYGETTELYYDWGGATIKNFKITNPFSDPTFELQAETTADGDQKAMNVTPVEGDTTKFIYQSGANELHPTHRQTEHQTITWSDTGGASDSLGSGWTLYKEITVSATNIDADLSHFPLYVSFSGDADIGGEAAADGANIRFTASDGSTLLPYRRRSFSITSSQADGEFIVATDLSSGGTTIRIWYDNSGAADGESNDWEVWDSGYLIAASLDQDPSGTAPQMTDDSPFDFDGTSNGSMTSGDSVSGLAGNALDMDGSNDYIDFTNLRSGRSQFHGEVTALTVEIFTNMDAGQLTGDGVICSKGTLSASTSAGSFTMWRDDSGSLAGRNNTFALIVRDSTNSNSARVEGADGAANSSGTWQGVAMSYLGNDGSGLKLYIDGAEDANSGTSTTNIPKLKNTSNTLNIGNDDLSKFFDGLLDEFRFSLTVRSAAWIKFTDANVRSNDNELTFSAEKSAATTTPVLAFNHLRNLHMA